MKFTWEIISKVFANLIGVENLARDEAGKEILTADQRETIKKHFGEEVLTLYEQHTAKGEEKGGANIDMKAFLEAVGKVGTENREALVREMAAAQLQISVLQDQVRILSGKREEAPAAVGGGKPGARTFQINTKHIHNSLAQSFLTSGQMPTISASTINVTELQSEFGSYSSQGNNIDMLRDIYTGFTTAKHMTKVQAIETYKATKDQLTSVVQEFSPKWTPSGESKFTAITIQNFRHKINFAIVPAEVGRTWLLHLYNEKMTPDQMPITRYIIQNILMPSIMQDVENMIGKGKYKKKVDETKPGKPEEAMDGIETILVEAAKSGDKGFNFYPNALDLRTATDEQVLNYIDDFAAKITQKYQRIKMNIFCSSDTYIKYKRAYKKKWGAGSGTENTEFGKDRVDFTNFSLQVLDCMYGSPIIFCTPKQNFLLLQNLNEPQVITDIQKIDYEVHFIGEFWLGVGFPIGEMVFASVPKDYNPQAIISNDGSTDFWQDTNTAPTEGA